MGLTRQGLLGQGRGVEFTLHEVGALGANRLLRASVRLWEAAR